MQGRAVRQPSVVSRDLRRLARLVVEDLERCLEAPVQIGPVADNCIWGWAGSSVWRARAEWEATPILSHTGMAGRRLPLSSLVHSRTTTQTGRV